MNPKQPALTAEQLRDLVSTITDDLETKDCRNSGELLAYARAELTGNDKAAIEAHISACAGCHEEVEEWRSQLDSLFLENAEPTAGLQAIRDMVRQAYSRRRDDHPIEVTPATAPRLRKSSPAAQMAAAATERTGNEISWFRALIAWFNGPILVRSMATALVFLGGLTTYQAGRLAERDSTAQSELVELRAVSLALAEMRESLRALNDARAAQDRSGDVAAAIRRVNFVQPTSLSNQPGLRDEYDDYARQLADGLLPLADMLVQAGMVKQARTLFAYQRSQHPEDTRYWFAEATMSKLDQDHEAALAIYQEMIRRGMAERDPRPYHFAGWESSELRRFDLAERYYDQALDLAPGYCKVYLNKAYNAQVRPGLAQAERERLFNANLRLAFDCTEKAYAAEGDANPRITFTLAILHAVRGTNDDRDRALNFLEKAILAERSYLTHAQADPAFAYFRDLRNEPYYGRFQNLISRYRVRSSQFGALQGPYDPKVFVE